MKKTVKIIAMVLALTMCFTLFTACGEKDPVQDETPKTDMEYVKEKGTLVVGITEFAPMDYTDANGNWIGFDADMAAAFAKSLGVEVKFQVIEWDSKVNELNGKTIDVVWNGMTLTDEVKSAMACSNAYMNNAQVIVLPADKVDGFDPAKANFAVEAGSAGKKEADKNGYTSTEVLDQATALLEVKSKTADAAIIDALMAGAMIGDGTSYADFVTGDSLNSEEYGVGFRQGSDLAGALNDFFKSAYADGSMIKVAETYGVQVALIEQK